jgi:GT2 family glycosyltransferase
MEPATVVIPHWNRAGLLRSVLASLAAQTRPPAEVIVVDNGSADDSVEVARRTGARVIEMGANAGFARAVNRGVAEALTPLVAILNNDVELDAEWLGALTRALAREDAWFATGKIYRAGASNLLDATWDALSRGGCAWRCGEGRADGSEWSATRRILLAPFTAALFRRELFERAGPLDEEFESYLEDVEFGLRCATHGLCGIYEPAAVARHRGSATLGVWHRETVRRMARNQLLLVARHYPSLWRFRYGWPVLVGQLLWGAVAIRHRAGLPWFQGKLEGLTRFRARRRICRDARVLEEVLERSEAEIRRLQRATGYDWYWRLYFALT